MNNFMSCGSDNNSWLWILIILLILCSCGGMLDGIIDKLTGCDWLVPMLLIWFCYTGKPGYCGCGK